MISDKKPPVRNPLFITSFVIAILAIVLAVIVIKVFHVPARQIKGRIKTVYYWGTSIVDKISSPAVGTPLLVPTETNASRFSGPLRVNPDNPRYFTDGTKVDGKYKVIYLTGAHTWLNLVDSGGSNPPPVFDYGKYLDFVQGNHHNFFRLWAWEQSRWTAETTDDNYWFYPLPYERSTICCALDGKNKFDLTKLNQAYFDRIRARVTAAGDRGIYVSIMLFDGWSVDPKDPSVGGGRNNPWKGHPFNVKNNINGIDGDTNHDGKGTEIHTNPTNSYVSQNITPLQEAYVKKVIDTVDDLDNVLYEICNECETDSVDWEYHMINFIHTYEQSKPKQHPVGMTHLGNDSALLASPADWVAIGNNASLIPLPANGDKVSLLDTDHICGLCANHAWIWEAFTRGHNPIFMDPYDGAGYGVGGAGFVFNDPWAIDMRSNLGYTMAYANRMNLATATPRPDLCSSSYCLASTTEFLAYFPSGGSVTIDLSAIQGDMSAEWFNPENGRLIDISSLAAGKVQSLAAPFKDDAVLYTHKSENSK